VRTIPDRGSGVPPDRDDRELDPGRRDGPEVEDEVERLHDGRRDAAGPRREEEGEGAGGLRDPEELRGEVLEGQGGEGRRKGPGQVDDRADGRELLRGRGGGGQRGLDPGEPAGVPVLRGRGAVPVHGDRAPQGDRLVRVEPEVPHPADEVPDPRIGRDDDRGLPAPEALEEELGRELVLLLRGRHEEEDGPGLRNPFGDELLEAVDAEAAHGTSPRWAHAALAFLTIPRPPRRAPAGTRFANGAARARGTVQPWNPPGPRSLLYDEDA
jgi:hypothetical protein